MASQAPFPLMPAKSTETRLAHFDEQIYKADSTTVLYRFMDALCGDTGAGSLKKEIFLARLGGALESIYFTDLDYIFGSVNFLSRAPSESYSFDPMTDMLTSDQWDEVKVKDAWYRARIKDFFTACSLGSTPDGLRMCVQAATSSDCDIYESWRYMDNWGLGTYLGRAPVGARNEVTVVPHKTDLDPSEFRLLDEMLEKITAADTIVTISTQGLAVSNPVSVNTATADSTYYQVEKTVTPSPMLAQVPPPELLAIDLDPTQQYLFSGSPELAPYAAFNISSEYGYYYLVSGGNRSPIDSVTYGILQADGSVKTEPNFSTFDTIQQFGPWQTYELADSPDNYPGGKFGQTPSAAPALNGDGTPYVFAYNSQADYVSAKRSEVINLAGQADDLRFRLPIVANQVSKTVFLPEYAIAYNAPAKDSTVTSSWTGRKKRTVTFEFRAESIFVRS